MRAQLSVGREELLSGYIDSGVNYPSSCTYYTLTNYASTFAGEALETWAIQTKPPKGKTQMF
jgi:hypothetical protein